MNRLSKIALVCALGINFLSLSAIAQTVAPHLPEVTPASADAYFKMANKPVGILLVSPNCLSCGEVEATIAGVSVKYPRMVFIKEDASLFNNSGINEPAFGVFVPGIGLVYQKLNFHPGAEDVDSFLAEREKKAVAEIALVNQLAEVSDKMKDASVPFAAQLKSIDDRGTELLAPINGEMKDLRKQIETLIKPHTDQIDQLQKQLEAATKANDDALKPLQEKLQILSAPFKAQSDEIVAAGRKASQNLVSELKSARDSHDKARFDAARAALDQVRQPYDDQLKTLRAKYDSASKQLVTQIKPLEKQNDEAAAPILIEIETAKLLAQDDSRILDAEVNDLKAQADGLGAPLDAQVNEIEKTRAEALKPFLAQQAKTKSDLEALVKADKS